MGRDGWIWPGRRKEREEKREEIYRNFAWRQNYRNLTALTVLPAKKLYDKNANIYLKVGKRRMNAAGKSGKAGRKREVNLSPTYRSHRLTGN